MANENEMVVEIVREMRTKNVEPNYDAIMRLYAHRIEAAHRREVAELKNKCEEYERQPELMAETAKAALELLKAQESKIAELCECLKEAVVYFCGNDKLADCVEKVYGNPKCETEGQHCMVERWRMALEGAKDEDK